ncbi:collagen, type I, alpha 1b-like [Equus asinus]|uniref:collagen, type I, alpha 1b-like n=1 Tax=Equus asinus TaxID=9793 RepID=UPI0038F74CD9
MVMVSPPCKRGLVQGGSRASAPAASASPAGACSPAGAAAGARGRLLDDSALGWPGAGASPLDWSGRAGRGAAASAIEERRGGSGAQCRAGAGAVRDRYGPGGHQAVGARVGPRSAFRLRFRPGGPGPPAESAALGAGDPGVRPSGRPSSSWGPGAPEPPTARVRRPPGDSCCRVPAGIPGARSGCRSLSGPRRQCPGESESPLDPAPFLGSRQPGAPGSGGVSRRLAA